MLGADVSFTINPNAGIDSTYSGPGAVSPTGELNSGSPLSVYDDLFGVNSLPVVNPALSMLTQNPFKAPTTNIWSVVAVAVLGGLIAKEILNNR